MPKKSGVQKEFIEKLYLEGLSLSEISQKLHIKAKYWFRKFGIKRRSRSEALKLAYMKGKRKKKVYLKDFIELYTKGLTDREIAKKIGVSASYISQFRRSKHLKSNANNCLKNPTLSPSVPLSYILGALKGDGFTYYEKKKWGGYIVGLEVTEKAFALRFHKALHLIGLNPSLRPRIRKTITPAGTSYLCETWRTQACSVKFCKWYRNLTLNDIKTLLPEKEHVGAFLQGFYDSEGCTSPFSYRSKYGKRYEYPALTVSNTNQELMNFVAQLLHHLGFNNKVRNGSKPRNPRYRQPYYIRVTGKPSVLLQEMISIW